MEESGFDYSVVIRTLGTAGKEYRVLLDSLASQTVQPREILVVVPDGNPRPQERLGTERVVSCERGLVHQRSFGIRIAQGEFLLLCDDDISFDRDFVERLHRTHLTTRAEIVTPKVLELGDLAAPTLRWSLGRIRDVLCGLLYVSNKPSPFYIRIWDTGGYIRNGGIRQGRQYYSQSGHGTCALLEREAAQRIRFQEEMWLDEASYALPDDQVMFYKAFLRGYRIAWCPEAMLFHHNASSRAPDRFGHMSYASGRNFTIFWHRFLYRPTAAWAKKVQLLCWLMFRIFNNCMLYALAYLPNPRRFRAATALYKGYVDAFRYLRTDEYRGLPPIVDRTAGLGYYPASRGRKPGG